MSHLDIQRIPRSHTEPVSEKTSNGNHPSVDISALVSAFNSDEGTSPPSRQTQYAPVPQTTITPASPGRQQQAHGSRPIAPASRPSARRNMATLTPGSDQPARRQSKWSAEEDAIIIELRGKGMKWEDISRNLPGRSAISCRLHYQNYLERRSEWDDQKKDKLAQLYERFKNKMWAELAEELQVPWRAAEAMHWQLGEHEMAKRAGTTPFTLAAVNAEVTAANRRASPARSQLDLQQPHSHQHLQMQRHSSLPREMGTPAPRTMYARSHLPPSGRPEPQMMAPRRDTAPPPRPAEHADMPYPSGPTIAPLQYSQQAENRPGQQLPSIAELTTGIEPYRAPYAGPPPPTQQAYRGPEYAYATPGPSFSEPAGVKRSSSEELYHESSSRRRRE